MELNNRYEITIKKRKAKNKIRTKSNRSVKSKENKNNRISAITLIKKFSNKAVITWKDSNLIRKRRVKAKH